MPELQTDLVALINEYVGGNETEVSFNRKEDLQIALFVLLSPDQFERLERFRSRTEMARQEQRNNEMWQQRMRELGIKQREGETSANTQATAADA